MESSPMTPISAALALIPARGGSKGIPGKNLQEIGGKPLIVRTIEIAQKSQRVGRVVVSTDDPLINTLALEAKAEVVKRPESISGDTASSELALLHALEVLEQSSSLPEKLVFLQCTAPFTTTEEIDDVLAALDNPIVNSSLSVKPFHGFLWQYDGRGVNHDPKLPRKRRQDLEPTYLENGAIYAMRTIQFRQSGSRFCGPCKPILVQDRGPEIDTPADLALCRSLYALTTPKAE